VQKQESRQSPHLLRPGQPMQGGTSGKCITTVIDAS
jgi:hypothetical protein